MSHESSALEIHHSPVDRKGTVELTVLIEGEEIHADRIEIGRADNRSKFADDLCRDRGWHRPSYC